MLVLTRSPQECIRVGDDIAIVVMDVKGKQVRLGVHAPRDVPVDREEIYQLKKRKVPPAQRVSQNNKDY